MHSACLLAVILSVVGQVLSMPGGAPAGACTSLRPGHNGVRGSNATDAADPPGGFYIYTELLNDGNYGNYTSGMMYRVTLQSIYKNNDGFRGFLIQAREEGTTDLIGTFMLIDSDNTQLLACPGDTGSATVTHTNNDYKLRVSFYWRAPTTGNGTVDFRYSVVTTLFDDFYADLSAADYRPPCNFPPTLQDDLALTFGVPEGCSDDECDYFVGFRRNEYDPEYLDVYLSGVANGWVAVGFSLNLMMEEDDVLGCRIDSSSVTAVDTWNPTGRYTPNVLDDTQDDICLHNGAVYDGRITCCFSRLINITDVGMDYNLNDDYWLFFGRRLTAQTGGAALASHRADNINPIPSERRYNPVMDVDPAPPAPAPSPSPTQAPMPTGCPVEPGTGDDYVFTQGTSGEGDYYLATRRNPNNERYLEVVLEGVADGWVAVGFSRDQIMRNDDVLGCRVDAGTVTVVDTYNPDTRRQAPNVIDDTQTDICLHSGSFVDGRISCRFSRLIQGSDGAQDFNLDDDFWLFYGRRLTAQTTGSNLAPHRVDDINPLISDETVNPSSALAISSSIVLLIVSVSVVLKVIY